MVDFAVSPGKNKWLKEAMEAHEIYEKDIVEKFIRSSGKGGQKVNKTSTCVYLKHIPTGIEVKCMINRSQSINRFLARRQLIEKITNQSRKHTTPEITPNEPVQYEENSAHTGAAHDS
ncbi:MAG: peptide chain release factor-like protein [Nitrospirae bacterium]|nr:peptide chain release factor-like protein [Nitrospirota bacterium]